MHWSPEATDKWPLVLGYCGDKTMPEIGCLSTAMLLNTDGLSLCQTSELKNSKWVVMLRKYVKLNTGYGDIGNPFFKVWWNPLGRLFLTYHKLTLIPACSSKNIHYNVWTKVTCPNFHGATVEFWDWRSDIIPYITWHVIIILSGALDNPCELKGP